MRYILLAYGDEQQLAAMSSSEREALWDACLANDQAGASYVDSSVPAAANGFWYLVRGVSCGGPGTYDTIDPSQIGNRDAEINASSNRCP